MRKKEHTLLRWKKGSGVKSTNTHTHTRGVEFVLTGAAKESKAHTLSSETTQYLGELVLLEKDYSRAVVRVLFFFFAFSLLVNANSVAGNIGNSRRPCVIQECSRSRPPRVCRGICEYV